MTSTSRSLDTTIMSAVAVISAVAALVLTITREPVQVVPKNVAVMPAESDFPSPEKAAGALVGHLEQGGSARCVRGALNSYDCEYKPEGATRTQFVTVRVDSKNIVVVEKRS